MTLVDGKVKCGYKRCAKSAYAEIVYETEAGKVMSDYMCKGDMRRAML